MAETNIPANPNAAMQAGLARLWIKFLPDIQQRLSVIESAAQSFREGSLSGAMREQAHADAHKLTGVLGTFGLQGGTELARQVELFFAEDGDCIAEPAAGSESSALLSGWIDELRKMIAGRIA